MGRVVEAVLPSRMGTPFRWLVGSAWAGNLGDGIALAADEEAAAAQPGRRPPVGHRGAGKVTCGDDA